MAHLISSIDRRKLLVTGSAALLARPSIVAAEPPPRFTAPANDYDEMWETLRDRYCFFDEKKIDWEKVRQLDRDDAIRAESYEDFTKIMTRSVNELYDPHTRFFDSYEGAMRSPPYDLAVEKHSKGARIIATRKGGAVEAAGLGVGTIITAVSGVRIASLVARLIPRTLIEYDPEAHAYALNVAVSGARGQSRTFTIIDASGAERTLALPRVQWPTDEAISWRRLESGVGYIAIRNFGDQAIVEQFDTALAEFREAPGLIIDVRRNGGGDTAVARPIMGRFIDRVRPYALMRRRSGNGLSEPWTEVVEPRGPFTFTSPVVVLANRWSGSMAEGFPMGMRGIGAATIMGTPMMQLGAAVFNIRLDRTGLEGQYSAEPVYDVDDNPRWHMKPDIELAADADFVPHAVREILRQKGLK